MASNEVLLKLQESMVKAVLSGQPLPGHDQPIRLPDLQFVTRQPFIYLLDTNLAGTLALPDLPKPLKIISPDTLRQEVQQQGEIAYLQFHINESTESVVALRLEARIASSDPNRRELGLSSIQLKFARQGDEWKATEPPISSAS